METKTRKIAQKIGIIIVLILMGCNMPTWKDVEAARAEASAEGLESESLIQGLPPGYIVGFEQSIDGDSHALTIGPGAADVRGVFVRRAEHILDGDDWDCLRLVSARYYLYLNAGSEYHVTIDEPLYNEDHFAYYHPNQIYRYIGEFYIDANDNIVIGVSREQILGQRIIIASSEFVGVGYHRKCDGTNDEQEINDAVFYLSEVYGGGVVELTEGSFYTLDAIAPTTSIAIEGRGAGSYIIKNGDFHGISKIATSGNEKDNISVKNLRIGKDSGDTNSKDLINFEYCDNLLIENVKIDNSKLYGIHLEYCDAYSIQQCFVTGADSYTFYIRYSSGIVNGNTIDGEATAKTTAITGIEIVYGNKTIITNNIIYDLLGSQDVYGIFIQAESCKIENNHIKNLTSTGGVGTLAFGIITTDSHYSEISNNCVDDIDHSVTVGDGRGVYVTGNDIKTNSNYVINCSGKGIWVGATRGLFSSNFCRNNGSDSGIANANEHNFDDDGTATMIHSNSWQGPYNTGWINRADWTNVHLGSDDTKDTDSNVEHNLNAPLSKLLVKVLISTDGTDANSFEIQQLGWNTGLAAGDYGITIFEIDSNNILVHTGAQGIAYIASTSWTVIIDTENWYYKVKVWYMG